MGPIAIIEAPSGLGLTRPGVEGLADRLLAPGLAERLGARRAARVEPPQAGGDIDPTTRVLNARELASFSPRLADAVEAALARAEFPLILGGDCSILLGSALALRRRGRYGLLFIDGNADFFQPEALDDGEAASMDLAFATGHGPDLLADIERLRPYVLDRDVVAFGWRDHEDQRQAGSRPLPPAMGSFDLPTIRSLGIDQAAKAAVQRLAQAPTQGFLIHLDADVLDDAVMPAVDFRIPDGLSEGDLLAVLRTALASGKAVGLEVAIYNPGLDPDGAAGERLATLLVRSLSA